MTEQFSNFAQTTLAAAITDTVSTTITVANNSSFPQAANFRIIIDSEIMVVTGGAGTNTWTVTRGAENSTAATHTINTAVVHILTAGGLRQGLLDYVAIVNQGRLTLTSGTPVTTTDVTGATTVYFTPYQGNKTTLYYLGVWTTMTFTETSVAVPATTNTPFDVFAYYTGSTVALETDNWTNSTTRATALAFQDGILVKSGDSTRRYLGTGCTTGTSGQCEDSKVNRYLWNYYNRKQRKIFVSDSTASWNYTSQAWRLANNTATNHQISVVIGQAEDIVQLRITVRNNGWGLVGIGVNSTTAVSSDVYFLGNGGVDKLTEASLVHNPAVGATTYSWLEYTAVSGQTATFENDTFDMSGMFGFTWS